MNFKGKSFLKLLDFTPEEISYLIDLAAKLKAEKKAGIPHKTHVGTRSRNGWRGSRRYEGACQGRNDDGRRYSRDGICSRGCQQSNIP